MVRFEGTPDSGYEMYMDKSSRVFSTLDRALQFIELERARFDATHPEMREKLTIEKLLPEKPEEFFKVHPLEGLFHLYDGRSRHSHLSVYDFTLKNAFEGDHFSIQIEVIFPVDDMSYFEFNQATGGHELKKY